MCAQKQNGADVPFEEWLFKQTAIKTYPKPTLQSFDPQAYVSQIPPISTLPSLVQPSEFRCNQLIAKLRTTKNVDLWFNLFEYCLNNYDSDVQNNPINRLLQVCIELAKASPEIRRKYEEANSYNNLMLLPNALLMPKLYEARMIDCQSVVENAERLIKENCVRHKI